MNKPRKVINNKALRGLIVSVGVLSTMLGVLGMFLPLLPTVPLLLLAAACFARSSERFHTWLIGHSYLGPMIHGYLDGKGIPLKAKVTAIGLIWVTIPVSAFFFVSLLWLKVLLLAIGLCITIYLLYLPLRQEHEA